jgi:hypothetical protein
MTIRDILIKVNDSIRYTKADQELVDEAEQAINAYILGEVMELIGEDDTEVRGTTQNSTNPKYWTKRTKTKNELRQELRNKANKQWGK